MVGSCKCGNEPLGPIKCNEFLGHLKTYFRKDLCLVVSYLLLLNGHQWPILLFPTHRFVASLSVFSACFFENLVIILHFGHFMSVFSSLLF